MTTACGSTTSKPATQKTVSLEEAPFCEYLKVLRKEGFEDDADISEQFYVGLLTQFGFTEEDIMNTPFNKLNEGVELIIKQSKQEVNNVSVPISVSGTMMTGEGAKHLSPESLQRLMMRQEQLLQEEKMRLNM